MYIATKTMSHIDGEPAHRGINDSKNALKATREYLFGIMLLFTIVLNISYAPFKNSTWWGLKKEIARLFLKRASPDHELFQEHKHAMAEERGCKLDTKEDEWTLFWSIKDMKSLKDKGPYVKLSRWCSWEQGFDFHKSELSTSNN